MKTNARLTSKEIWVKKIRHNDNMISVPVVNVHAAGIDVGSTSHFVCVEFSIFYL